jgi:hypothetical protein
MENRVSSRDDAPQVQSESPQSQDGNESSDKARSRLRDIICRVSNLGLAAAVFFATEIPIDPDGLGGWGISGDSFSVSGSTSSGERASAGIAERAVSFGHL